MTVLTSRAQIEAWDKHFRVPRPFIFIVFIRRCIYNLVDRRYEPHSAISRASTSLNGHWVYSKLSKFPFNVTNLAVSHEQLNSFSAIVCITPQLRTIKQYRSSAV